MTQTTIPASQNTQWGFFGTMNEAAEAAWVLATAAISEATGYPLNEIQPFLDSRHGRHFADDVQSNLQAGQDLQQAIKAATARWMGWSIDRHTSKELSIPRGMPYLTGFVGHCLINEEAA